jgi:hypothetical protein
VLSENQQKEISYHHTHHQPLLLPADQTEKKKRSVFMKKMVFTMLTVFFLATTASLALAERQPHMHAAIKQLQQAKNQLEKATHDKGGHRVRAIQLIDQAIAEVRAGIEFDNMHSDKPGRR